MGAKLESFLRVMGSALSPQAAQANTAQYAAEQADKRLQQREGRAEIRADKANDFKMGIKTVAVRVEAMKEANKAGDKVAFQKLGDSINTYADENFDPENAAKLKNLAGAEWMEGAGKPKTEKTAVMFDLPGNGGQVPAVQRGSKFVYRDEQGQEVDLPFGSTKSATKQLAGTLSKTQKGKLTLGGIEGEQNVRNNLRDIDSLIETVSSPDFLGGNLGNAVQALNSARAQVTQIFGGENYLAQDGSVNPNAFRTDSKFRKQAIQGNLAESQTLELAFILAKSLNPDGKISDADVRQAGKILGDSADPMVRKKLLDNAKKRMVERYNSDQSVIARTLRKKGENVTFTPLTIDGLKKKKGAGTDAASRIMQNVGFPE